MCFVRHPGPMAIAFFLFIGPLFSTCVSSPYTCVQLHPDSSQVYVCGRFSPLVGIYLRLFLSKLQEKRIKTNLTTMLLTSQYAFDHENIDFSFKGRIVMAHQLRCDCTATGCIFAWLQNINATVETQHRTSPRICFVGGHSKKTNKDGGSTNKRVP